MQVRSEKILWCPKKHLLIFGKIFYLLIFVSFLFLENKLGNFLRFLNRNAIKPLLLQPNLMYDSSSTPNFQWITDWIYGWYTVFLSVLFHVSVQYLIPILLIFHKKKSITGKDIFLVFDIISTYLPRKFYFLKILQ